MRRWIARFARDESGATAVEYGIILAMMFLVILSALMAFGEATSNLFNMTMTALRAAIGG
jgi:pilus assembly protein Flp/PilA